MLIEEIITKEAWPLVVRTGLGVLGRTGMGLLRGLGRGAKATGRGAGRVVRGAERLSRFFRFDPEAKKIHDDMEATQDEQERERLRLELERRIKQWEDNMDVLFPHTDGKSWGESVNERELTKKEERNKEHNVKQLKPHKDNFSKYGKDAESVMYAVATKQAKKGNRFKS